LIHDLQAFDVTPQYLSAEVASASQKLSIKEQTIQLDKKINLLRLSRQTLKTALTKKFRKSITEKMLALFENNFL